MRPTRRLAVLAAATLAPLLLIGAALPAQAVPVSPHVIVPGTWAQTAIPNAGPGVLSSNYDDVSCVATGFCLAVGGGFSGAATTPLVSSWNGTTWNATTPMGAPDAGPNGVSCRSASWCMVVGAQSTGAFADVVDGNTWTALTLPSVPGAITQLYSVSCTSTTACSAVGDSVVGMSLTPWIVQWDGTSWSAASLPSGIPAEGSLNSVSCVPGACQAVGNAGSVGLHLQGTGATWTSATSPAGVGEYALYSVSCGSPTSCVTVGSQNNAVSPAGLAQHFDGSSWTTTPVPPATGGTSETLQSVDCVGATSCVAVGVWTGTTGNEDLVEAWDGTSWVQQPVQGVGTEDVLSAVSCAVGASCVAVGSANLFTGQAVAAPLQRTGYDEVASDGGIFNFGDAPLLGSMGGTQLNRPVVGIAVTSAGGYYEVASDGGLFNFGAPFLGSMGGSHLNEPVVAIAS